MSWNTIGATLLLVTLICVPLSDFARAEAFASPVAIPRPSNLAEGYDWASRTLSQHFVIDAQPFESTLSLDTVTKPQLDIQITGLMPWRQYSFVTALTSVPTHGGSDGSTVLWSIPAEAATWVLTDGRSGEPVTSLVITPRTPSLVMTTSECSTNCGDRASPPQPTTNDIGNGNGMIAGAFSFTPGVTIAVQTGWGHDVKTEAKATAGDASKGGPQGVAGMDYTFTEKSGFAFSASGKPHVVRRNLDFKQDKYRDGSTVTYATGRGKLLSETTEDIYWAAPQDTESRYIQDGLNETRCETGNLGVHFGVGVTVSGLGLSVDHFRAQGTNGCVTFAYTPGAYRIKFYNDDGSSDGLAGAAWSA